MKEKLLITIVMQVILNRTTIYTMNSDKVIERERIECLLIQQGFISSLAQRSIGWQKSYVLMMI